MQWTKYTLRGISQIFFVNNALSGVLILLGIALFSPFMAALVVLGSLVQTGVGYLQKHRAEVPDGLMGFNGALVGAFAGFSHLPPHLAILATLLGAAACVPVHDLVARLFSLTFLAKASLPVSTAPFCAVAGALEILTLTLIAPASASSSPEPGAGLLLSLGNSFSEVVLADGWLSGLIIMVGLFIASVRIGIFGVLGVATASIVSFTLLHADMATVSTGLQNYSAVLVAIALGAVFWAEESAVVRTVSAVTAAAVTPFVASLLALTQIPVFTWPFLLTMWFFMLIRSLSQKHTAASPDSALPKEPSKP